MSHNYRVRVTRCVLEFVSLKSKMSMPCLKKQQEKCQLTVARTVGLAYAFSSERRHV